MFTLKFAPTVETSRLNQKGQKRIYNKLDTCYANKDFFSFNITQEGNFVQVYLYTLSDHHPITANLTRINQSMNTDKHHDGFAINTSLLHDENINAAINFI